MRKILAVSFGLAVCFPSAALAQAPTPAHVQQYVHAYHAVRHLDGPAAAGCNLIGRLGSCHVRASDTQVTKSLGVLYRTLNPPPPPPVRPVSGYAYTTTRPATPAYTSRPSVSHSTGYSIPSSIVQCESGGNWSAVNSSSGAGGAYQILPSTWQAYGGQGAPQDASPAEQSRIAGEIMATQGRSAWVC